MKDQFPKITLKEAISYIYEQGQCIGAPRGAEYLDGKHVDIGDGRRPQSVWRVRYWVPSKFVVDEFKRVIGDKWETPMKLDKLSMDLYDTNIVFDGNYIIARGGLCPSGVRLFEVTDIENLKDFKL